MAEITTFEKAFVKRAEAKTPKGKVTVGEASVEVVPANPSRVCLTVCNESTAKIWLAKGPTAAKEEGIFLIKEGSPLIMEDYNGVVTAIASAAASNLTFSET